MKQLENMPTKFKSRAKLLGYGGAESMYEVKGGKSLVRFKQGQKLQFIVGGVPRQVDPSTIVKLIKFKVKKKKRVLLASKTNPTVFVPLPKVGGGVAGGDTDYNPGEAIPIQYARYGKESLKITPANPLPPGEYTLAWVAPNQRVYCFGIDG